MGIHSEMALRNVDLTEGIVQLKNGGLIYLLGCMQEMKERLSVGASDLRNYAPLLNPFLNLKSSPN
jgi:hypothetical protein